MKKVEWLPTTELNVSSPEKVWIKVEYVLVGGNLRMKAVIKGQVVHNGYSWHIEPDTEDLLFLNRNAAIDGEWNPEDGKPLVHVSHWAAREDDDERPTAFSSRVRLRQ
jgi:hypothetical protein